MTEFHTNWKIFRRAIAVLWLGCEPRVLAGELEIYPRHFALQLGELIHYSAMVARPTAGHEFLKEFEFSTSKASVLRLKSKSGVFEAAAPGHAAIVLRAQGNERRFEITVLDERQAPMRAVRNHDVPPIRADELLIVGHANRDGYDHTAVAKSGIDHWIRDFKKRKQPVVYVVSAQYPNWYTSDRDPTHAIISEGQDHDLQLDVDTIYFAGGDFRLCLLRNVQFVLHRMVRQGGNEAIHIVFLLDAIWTGEKKRPYPAPMQRLDALFDRAVSRQAAYDSLVLPLLNRMINEYPVAGHPGPDETPPPDFKTLLANVGIRVNIEDRYRTTFRPGGDQTIWMEFRRKRSPR